MPRQLEWRPGGDEASREETDRKEKRHKKVYGYQVVIKSYRMAVGRSTPDRCWESKYEKVHKKSALAQGELMFASDFGELLASQAPYHYLGLRAAGVPRFLRSLL